MPFFPIINFHAPVPQLGNGLVGLSKGPRSMVSLLANRGIITPGEQADLLAMNMTSLEQDIFHRINMFNPGDDLDPIFHRIQIWGGLTGRNIYIRGGGWNGPLVLPWYSDLVFHCLQMNPDSPFPFKANTLFHAVDTFNRNVANIGIPFITKHTQFWLHRSLGDDALPIYDSKMARIVMHQRRVRRQDLIQYWIGMNDKATLEGISLFHLERLLFFN